MKRCGVCGMNVSDESAFCPSCGASLEGGTDRNASEQIAFGGAARSVTEYGIESVQQKPMNGIGLAGMIIGILSYIFCWVPVFNFILGLIGVILSGVGLSRKARFRLNGFAITGLVLSIIGLFIGLIYMTAFFVVLGTAA